MSLEKIEARDAAERGEPVGCAEREVGRFVYTRIERLMSAKADTPEGAELSYLAQIVSDVEEYGATGAEERTGAAPAPIHPPASEGLREAVAWAKGEADAFAATAKRARAGRDGQVPGSNAYTQWLAADRKAKHLQTILAALPGQQGEHG